MWVGMGVSPSVCGTNKDRLTDGAGAQLPSQLEGSIPSPLSLPWTLPEGLYLLIYERVHSLHGKA